MKKNFKKLAILSIVAFSLLATHQTFAMKENKPRQAFAMNHQLNRHDLLIVSKYFNSYKDYASLVKTCKEYGEIPDQWRKNFVPLTKKELKSFSEIETYYVYGEKPNEFKPTSFDERISDTKILKDTNIKKIIYKSGSFDVQTIIDVMNNGINERTIRKENLENKSSNVDFNIVCEFDNDKTIEFEVRLGKLATNANRVLDTHQGIEAYNKFAVFSGQNTITKYDIAEFNFPDGVQAIGVAAFSDCTNLTTINIPNSIKSISSGAFSHCTHLTTINIPNSVKNIGWWAFSQCTNLTTINIPNSVKSIGNETFSDCTNLTTINIPNSVTSIGSEAFSRCRRLTNITYNGNTYHSVDDFFAAFQANGGRVG